MKKKNIVALLLILAMMLALWGCAEKQEETGKEEQTVTEATGGNETQAPTQAETQAPTQAATQPQQNQEPSNANITYADIIGTWSADIDMLDVVKAKFVARNGGGAEFDEFWKSIPEDSFTVTWSWVFAYDALEGVTFMNIACDVEDYNTKKEAFYENYLKACFEIESAAGSLPGVTYEAYREKYYEDAKSDIEWYIFDMEEKDDTLLFPTFNCCYYCDGGQVYIGDVLEQEPASIKIDGNTMTISECPAAELIRFDETVAEILFPLVLEKQQ